jgi:prepilin-type N-terminal cleavage/methylation domain-containing protein
MVTGKSNRFFKLKEGTMRRGTFRLISTITNQLFGYGCSGNKMSGLTLVEMLVSISVIGLISVITLPALMAQLTGCRIEGNANEISSALMVARLKAIETHMPHRVKFDLNSNPQQFIIQRGITSQGVTTWVDNVTINKMKENVVISRVDDDKSKGKSRGIGSIEFDSIGTPTRGVVYLKDNEGEKYTITLNAATGKITKIKG